MTEKRFLQAAIALAAFVPVLAGLDGMAHGAAMAGGGGPSLDSHVRYLSGLLFGLGLLFWSAVPNIERHGELVRALTLMVVLGGLARAAGVLQHGWPSIGMRFGMVMELAVTPLICLWQARIAAQGRQWAGRPVTLGVQPGAAMLSAKPLARR